MKAHTLSGLITALVSTAAAALCCTACLQELPLGDKYLNEAAGFLRVQNASSRASYTFKGFELRDAAGRTVQTWDGLDLKQGGTWTGDVGREGLFTLYCKVWNEDEQAAGRYEYDTVAIKLHEVTDSKIAGEAFFTDTDGDGFSDSWERAYGFNPESNADGGPVYVSSVAENDNGKGTLTSPYKTLAKGVWKAKYGLDEGARTVVVDGILPRTSGNPGSDTSVFYIADTGTKGVTVTGKDPAAVINAQSDSTARQRALYLGPGTRLTLKNITIKNGYAFWGAGIHADGAELTLGPGAKIQNCYSSGGATSGAAIYASNGAAIVMEDGSLIGDDDLTDGDDKKNTTNGEAGAIGLYGSSLTMKNGSLIQGNQSNWGGAVSADQRSLVTLETGSAITRNTSNFNFRNSSSISHGGGVRLTKESKLLMTGGSITFNTVIKGGGGGGVYVGPEAVLDLRGGEISGNTAEETASYPKGNGGGVYVDTEGIFLMSGGTIAGNTAKGKGGGVYVKGGSFAKTGGQVYGSGASQNTAAAGTGNGQALYATNPVTSKDVDLQENFTL